MENELSAIAYPVMLDLTDVRCLIVGGGPVAARKVAGLLNTGAAVRVLSPEICAAVQHDVDTGLAEWERSAYTPDALTAYRPRLVFAATDSPAVNRQIAEDAREAGLWVNVASQPDQGSFTNMAVIQRPPIVIGLHTGGMSPALTRHLKTLLDEAIGDEYAMLAAWLGDLRPTIRQQISPQARRQALYQSIVDSDVLALLKQGETETARQHLHQIVDTAVRS